MSLYFGNIQQKISTPPSPFPTTGLVSYWRFDETTGTAADDAYGTNNLTLSNGSWATGKNNSCIYLSNSGAYAIASATSIFDFERTDPFSFSFWIKRASIDSVDMIAGKEEYAGNYKGYAFWFRDAAESLVYDMFNSSSFYNRVIFNGNFNDTTSWHNYIFTNSGNGRTSGMNAYYDGGLLTKSSVAYSDTLNATIKNTRVFRIGTRFDEEGGNRLRGYVDESAVWSKELTSTEVSQIYNSGNGSFY